MAPIRISAVLPCFEESAVLPAVVEQLVRVLGNHSPEGWEIILVVSRAAADDTPVVAERLAHDIPGVRCVFQAETDSGYGRAVQLGLAAASCSWVLLTDADGQFDHRDLSRLVESVGAADAIVGIRRPRRDPHARRIAGWAYSAVVSRLAGLGSLKDVDCAFKLIRLGLLEHKVLRCRTGAINAEILMALVEAGGRIVEVPVTHLPRPTGSSRFSTSLGLPRLPETLAVIREALALASRRRWPLH